MPDYAHCLAGFVDALGLGRPHVVGLSFGGAVALELYRRHPTMPKTLVLASAYAGWAGSLPADAVEERLKLSLRSSETTCPLRFVAKMLPTVFSKSASKERVGEFASSVAEFHTGGFRAMAWASAESDLRDVLGRIDLPTLLLYGSSTGDEDVRAERGNRPS